jgi:hypothetical protein
LCLKSREKYNKNSSKEDEGSDDGVREKKRKDEYFLAVSEMKKLVTEVVA